MGVMVAMAVCFAKPSPLSFQTGDAVTLFPRHGIKWAVRSTRLSTRRVAVRASGVKGAKLVTLVGKGGAGKTTAAVLAAQYYASTGMRTCLLIQSQDPTADVLLGQKLGSAPSSFRNGNLTAFRLETTKMIIEPLAQIKSADARQNFSQGALDEIKGEELSVLPGMDPILAMGAIERLTGFTGGLFKGMGKKDDKDYDVVVYDGLSSDEIFRMFGSAERARWYVNRFRSIAEKTDAGRVALPSVLRLMESAFLDESKGTTRSTNEIWDATNRILQRVVETFQDPNRFSCFLVTNPSNSISVDTALRYWGCATQAGVHVAGALYPFSSTEATPPDADFGKKFVPLPVAGLPYVSFASPPNWDEVVGRLSKEAKGIMSGTSQGGSIPAPVTFDQAARTVTLFLPGFQKSDIKLSQLRGGAELLVEAGDQRRSVVLPAAMRGKVSAAKFLEKSLVVTIKAI
ncbi:hypothetical protein KC19_2G134900 [Ceratodon purpureus]|uniref:Uncharacterized protein n=2 Tax=Ceratodon purpureus TaxID=3225 RepID=A0A8T0IV64_CERPU|nr:hypothetical protein KC19_2G134900 [Ceratodon purpureus]